jgi:hypothetical protein
MKNALALLALFATISHSGVRSAQSLYKDGTRAEVRWFDMRPAQAQFPIMGPSLPACGWWVTVWPKGEDVDTVQVTIVAAGRVWVVRLAVEPTQRVANGQIRTACEDPGKATVVIEETRTVVME